MRNHVAHGAVLLGAFALVAACAKGDNKTTDSSMQASTDSMTMRHDSTAPAPQLTDPNIAAILDGANVADSSAGSVAAKKGTNAQVRAFGTQMMRDHHSLRKQGQDLVKKLNVTPVMPAGDNSEASAKAWVDSLNSMPKGAAWDKAYIDHEVSYHEAVLKTATAALAAAQNADLKALITKAAPAIQGHLDHAKAIQAKLGGASGGAMMGSDTGMMKKGTMKKGAMKKPY